MDDQPDPPKYPKRNSVVIGRVPFGLLITLFGLLLFVVGAKPQWFGLTTSPAVSLVQICTFLIGLGVICLGGYVSLAALWDGESKSIVADVGIRLVATGYIISVFAGMADVIGVSMQDNPRVPFFGPWQQAGVETGMVVIALGMLMLIPYRNIGEHRL